MTRLLKFPSAVSLTQGTIFIGGAAEDYDDCRTYGLVITARCDAVNEKTQTYNYLPVVHLNDWLHRDGILILAERAVADIKNGMRNVLRTLGHSPSILDTEAPDRILAIIFSEADKKTLGSRSQFESLCQKWNQLSAVLSSDVAEAPYFLLTGLDIKNSEQLIRELVQHRLAGYYFLPSVELEGEDIGYVVLLREVHHMRREITELLLRSGIAQSDFEAMCNIQPSYKGRLNILENDIAMPISMLNSPNMEHLMQTFSNLFGRIGISNIPNDYVQELCRRQPSYRKLSK